MGLKLQGGNNRKKKKEEKLFSSRKIREKVVEKEKVLKNRNLVHKHKTLAVVNLIDKEENGVKYKVLDRKLAPHESFDAETIREIKELVVYVMNAFSCTLYHACIKMHFDYSNAHSELKKDPIFQELVEDAQQKQAEQRLDLAEEVFMMRLQQGDLSAAEKIVTLHKAAIKRGWGKLREDAQATITVIQTDPDLAAKIEDLRLKSQRMIDVSPV